MKNGMKVVCLVLLAFATASMWAQDDTDTSAAKPDKAAAPESHPAPPVVPPIT